MATAGPSVRSEPDAGPAHVAVVSFLASRVVPSGGFWVALAGGVALARVAERRGLRRSFGVSIASMLETVAIIGPLRFGVPLTQAVTAPLLGLHGGARAWPAWLQMLVCGVLRLAQNSLQTAIFIWILAGGLDAYAGTYDAHRRPASGSRSAKPRRWSSPRSGLVAWATFASVVQVLVYRRGLARWDSTPVDDAIRRTSFPGRRRPAAATDALPPGRRDRPRSATRSAASDARARLRSLRSPPARARRRRPLRDPARQHRLARARRRRRLPRRRLGRRSLRPRAAARRPRASAALLGVSVFLLALIGGLGLEVALRRAARAVLLVMTATWLRAAARAEGLRFAFRRALRRLRRIPSIPEAARVLDSLESEARLVASGRAFAASLEDVPTARCRSSTPSSAGSCARRVLHTPPTARPHKRNDPPQGRVAGERGATPPDMPSRPQRSQRVGS